ncbi:response regulator [Streptomyces sp. TX20-6-3]|uniref:response regulator n=1 Tax=Streptomyces sp. TX20-6-3 TaxID=3028705 RepID=UPI0029B93C06|nr:response regulator [Streptomyces sp. TX20-6-3]MDX2565299.1 response regulator [Streptomyces sp. TX20-6-3]
MTEIGPPRPHVILVVDDDDDVHQVTRIALRTLKYNDRGVELLHAYSGAAALEIMSSRVDVSVILLDVVMESNEAGLDTCKSIREEIGNQFVRILLRTGQPGMAPEKRVVEDYGIDGYLAKGEMTSTRLTTMVRTALKSYTEITDLEALRRSLESVHESVRDIPHSPQWAEFGRGS